MVSGVSRYTSVDDALSMVKSRLNLNRAVERVKVENAFHRVSSRTLVAPNDVPEFATSHMDGFAVASRDVEGASKSRPAALRLMGTAGPGSRLPRPLRGGEAAQVATGAVLPAGADAVVPKEYAEVKGRRVLVKLAVEKGGHVFGAGDDIRRGDVVLASGRPVRAQDIGLMISLRFTRVEVWKRPRLTVIATGSELTRSARPGAGKVRESHSHVFLRLIEAQGCVALDGGVVGDSPRALVKALRRALGSSDLVVTLGGTSAGGRDLIVDAVADLHPDVLLHGIRLDRGRVTGIASVNSKPILMLPGPIQAALNAFLVLGIPLIDLLSGRENYGTEFTCTLAKDWEARKRFSDFRKVVYVKLRTAEETVAEPMLAETESMKLLTDSDAYLVVPESVMTLKAGSRIKVRLLPGFSGAL